MFQSLRARLVLTHLLVGGLVLVLLAISFLAIQVSNPAAERFIYERLDLISRAATSQERLRPGIFVDAPLERTLNVLGRNIEATGVVINSAGRVLAVGPGDPPALPAGAIAEITASQQVVRGSFRGEGSGRWLYLSRTMDSGRYLVLLAPRPTFRTVFIQLREMITPIWQAALLALLSSVLVSLLLARWVSRPLSQLTSAAGEVANGIYDRTVPPRGPDELKNLARAFNRMVNKVRASQQSQRDFIANVSHELKTPLTSIAGFAQAIIDGTASDPEEQRRAAQIIHQESQRLRRMVDQLLSLARFDAGQVELDMQKLDLSALLRGSVERMSPAAQAAGVELRLDLGQLPPIAADADRLSRVVMNLVDNAVKHTQEGGWVEVSAAANGQWIMVSVRDNGVGLQADQIDRIFERFYQVDAARARGDEIGAGLGLAISQEIIRAHGGSIFAESQPGFGSRFYFKIPVAPSEASTLDRQRR